MSLGRGSQAARTAAAAVVIAGGIKLASPMLAPFLLSLFIAAVTAPIVFHLRRRGVPDFLAISLAILVASIPLPWIAVLIANDRPPRRAEEPRRYEGQGRIPLFPTAERPALETCREPAPQPESAEWQRDVP